MPFLWRAASVFAALLLLAGCDPTAPQDLREGEEPLASALKLSGGWETNPPWLTGVLVASYTAGAQGYLDVLYEPIDGLDVSHKVVFIGSWDKVIAAIEYQSDGRSVAVAGRWPGVPASTATHRIFDGETEVYANLTPARTGRKSWVPMGLATTGGRSFHIKPGEVRVDNEEVSFGAEAKCTPEMGLTVLCTEHMLDFDIALPAILKVEVWAESDEWFHELSYSAQ